MRGLLTATPSRRGYLSAGGTFDQDDPGPEFSIDASAGAYMSAITSIGFRWDLGVTPALRAKTRNPSGGAITQYDVSNFASLTTLSNGYVATIAGGITITATWTLSGQRVLWTLVVVNNSSLSVYDIEWPRMRVSAPSGNRENAYLAIPIWSGFVIQDPAADTTEEPVSMPSCLGFHHYYDRASKHGLYIEKQDDGGYGMDVVRQGQADGSLLLFCRHFPGEITKAGNDWTQPYTLSIETLQTKGDGRSGYVDAAQKHAQWALAKSGSAYLRPWLEGIRTTRGRWFDGLPGYSARVSACKFWVMYQDANAFGGSAPNWTNQTTDLTRIHDFIGLDYTKVLAGTYHWHTSLFDTTAPVKLPARTGYSAWVAAVQALGAHVFPYTLLPYWDQTNGAPYQITSYTVFGFPTDLRVAMFQNPDGTLQLGSIVEAPTANIGGFDPVSALTSSVWAQLLSEYLSVGAVHGFYCDQLTGTSYSNFNHSPSLNPNGNRGGKVMDKWNRIKELTDVAKFLDSGAFTIGEQFEEAALGGMEATLANQNNGGAFGLCVQANVVPMVYGQWYRRLDLTVQVTDPSNGSMALPLANQVIGHWLGGGLLGYHNGKTPGVIAPSLNTPGPSTDSALVYTMIVAKYLHDAHARCIDAFKGLEQRPLPGSWQLRAIEEASGSDTGLAGWLQSADLSMPKSVWKTDDGALWIIRVNHNHPGGVDDLLEFDVVDYGLDETVSRTLYRDIGAGLVSVGTYAARVSYAEAAPVTTGVTVFKLI